MTLCKHSGYKIIDWIKSPKWSTKEILINTEAVTKGVEHYIVRFSDESPKNLYGWFYLSGKVIRRHKTQPNGNGRVYVVPLSKREAFEPMKTCQHELN